MCDDDFYNSAQMWVSYWASKPSFHGIDKLLTIIVQAPFANNIKPLKSLGDPSTKVIIGAELAPNREV